MNSDEINYRILVPLEAGKPPVICAVQWFDENDYNADLWLKGPDGEPLKFESRVEAEAYLPALLVLASYGVQNPHSISKNFRDAEALGYPKLSTSKETTIMAAPRKTTVPAGAKKPQDHQTAAEETVDEGFSFEVDGKTYTLLPAKERMNRGFYRRIRKESQVDQMFSMVEELAADDATLDAFDSIPDEDFKDVFADPFNTYLKSLNGASVGESSAS